MELLGQRLYTFNVVVDTPTLPSKEASPIYTPGNGASLGNCSNSQFMPITWQPGPSKLWSFDLHFFNYGRELISLIMEWELEYVCCVSLFICELYYYPLLLLSTGLFFSDWCPSTRLRAAHQWSEVSLAEFLVLAGAEDLWQGHQLRAGCFQSIASWEGLWIGSYQRNKKYILGPWWTWNKLRWRKERTKMSPEFLTGNRKIGG